MSLALSQKSEPKEGEGSDDIVSPSLRNELTCVEEVTSQLIKNRCEYSPHPAVTDVTLIRSENMLAEKIARSKSLEQAPLRVPVLQQEPCGCTTPAAIEDRLCKVDGESDVPVRYRRGIYPNEPIRFCQKRRLTDSEYPTPCEGTFIGQLQDILPIKKHKLSTSQPTAEDHVNTCANTSSEEDESDTETFPWSALKKHEFHFDFWTDVDSDSPDSLSRHDWCLSAVRTRLSTSSRDVKQYWTWEPEKNIFRHRVPKGGKWCLLKHESNFHVYAAEIVEIEWNIEARLVHIVMRKNPIDASADGKPRGDVMASFPRKNTMRRFLFFCREERLVLVKKDSEELNRVWRSIVSEQLPGPGDSTQQLAE